MPGLHLRDRGFKVELVNVAQPCESKPGLDSNDPAARFANEKARRYQNLADAFERELVEGLSDDETIAQLSRLLYEIDSRGRVKIESKENAAQRAEPSPDRAEALMLALGEPPAIMEFRSVRELALPSPRNPSFEDDNPSASRGKKSSGAKSKSAARAKSKTSKRARAGKVGATYREGR